MPPADANMSKVFDDKEEPVKMDFTQALIFPQSQRRPDDYYDKIAVPIAKPKAKVPEVPKVDFKAPKLEGPKMAAPKAPMCGMCCKPKAPTIKGPEVPKLNAPKFEGPKIQKPGCCGGLKLCCGSMACCKPKIKGPEIPKVDLRGPKFEGPKIQKPGCCGGLKLCCGSMACCGACCKPKAPELKMKAPTMAAPKLKGPSFEGPKMAAPKTPYCGTCCKPKAPPKPQYQAVGNGFAVIPIHNANVSNNMDLDPTGKHPMPGYAIVPISKTDQQKLLNQKIEASNVITSLQNKEVLGSNGYAVLPFDSSLPKTPTKPREVFKPLPEPELPQ